MVQSPSFCQLENQFITLLEICKTTYQLKQIHSQVIKLGLSSSTIRNKFIALYSCPRQGDIIHARQLFDEMTEPSIFLWNTMIKGYSGMETPEYGLHMYMDMLKKGVKPDKYTYPFLLKGFRSSNDVAYTCGMQLLGHIIMLGFDSNEHVRSALVHMFSSSGQIQMARKFFNLSCKWDVITWNELMSGYNKVKQFDESKRLYMNMEQNVVLPTSITFLLALMASSKSKDLRFGEEVHRSIRESKIQCSLRLENALINMYTACGEMNAALQIFERMKRDVISWTTIVMGFVNEGRIDHARKYFDEMPQRDRVSWTAMINGYLKANEFREALKLFGEMQTSKVKADEFTIVSILIACANLGALELGEWAKTLIDQNSVKNDIFVGNALIDMYFKCGCVEQATSEFNRMLRRDKFTWTTMIVGLASNGHGEKALHIFSEMLRASIKPDGITYLGVLMACAHTGMVEMGTELFSRMTAQHGIKPELAHFGCLIDLLGRSGLLKEAKEVVINSMPMRPNAVIWGALLGACKLHKDQEMAEMAAKEILELEPENEAVYVLLCNVFAACRMWEKLSEVRRIMTNKGIQKDPGCSSIEINGSIHKFVAGDESHLQSDEIYAKLEEVMTELRHAGYRSDTS